MAIYMLRKNHNIREWKTKDESYHYHFFLLKNDEHTHGYTRTCVDLYNITVKWSIIRWYLNTWTSFCTFFNVGDQLKTRDSESWVYTPCTMLFNYLACYLHLHASIVTNYMHFSWMKILVCNTCMRVSERKKISYATIVELRFSYLLFVLRLLSKMNPLSQVYKCIHIFSWMKLEPSMFQVCKIDCSHAPTRSTSMLITRRLLLPPTRWSLMVFGTC